MGMKDRIPDQGGDFSYLVRDSIFGRGRAWIEKWNKDKQNSVQGGEGGRADGSRGGGRADRVAGRQQVGRQDNDHEDEDFTNDDVDYNGGTDDHDDDNGVTDDDVDDNKERNKQQQ